MSYARERLTVDAVENDASLECTVEGGSGVEAVDCDLASEVPFLALNTISSGLGESNANGAPLAPEFAAGAGGGGAACLVDQCLRADLLFSVPSSEAYRVFERLLLRLPVR